MSYFLVFFTSADTNIDNLKASPGKGCGGCTKSSPPPTFPVGLTPQRMSPLIQETVMLKFTDAADAGSWLVAQAQGLALGTLPVGIEEDAANKFWLVALSWDAADMDPDGNCKRCPPGAKTYWRLSPSQLLVNPSLIGPIVFTQSFPTDAARTAWLATPAGSAFCNGRVVEFLELDGAAG